MEPTQTAISVFRFQSSIKRIEYRKQLVRAYKRGDEVIREEVDIGWFAVFEGSWEAIFLGQEDPQWKTGDNVIITIQRLEPVYAFSS